MRRKILTALWAAIAILLGGLPLPGASAEEKADVAAGAAAASDVQDGVSPVLPQERRVPDLGDVTKSRTTVWVDAMVELHTDVEGALYVQRSAGFQEKVFEASWDFPAVELTVGKNGKKGLEVFSAKLHAGMTFSPRYPDGERIWSPDAESIRIQAIRIGDKSVGDRLPAEMRGLRIWELDPGSSGWIWPGYLRVDRKGAGWVGGWIPLRRAPFEGAIRVVMLTENVSIDVDLATAPEWRWRLLGDRPRARFCRDEEFRKKNGPTAAQLVDVLPVRHFLLPLAEPAVKGRPIVSGNPPPGR